MTNYPGVPASKGRRVDLARHRGNRARGRGVALTALLAGMLGGCLDRPVSPASPNVTNVFVDRINQDQVDKIDLLFMIDTSLSMADKQAFLQDAVPGLLNRLVDPNCVDPSGNLVAKVAGACPDGAQPEFTPINDIHIGVVSSSLGGRGKPCAPGGTPTVVEDDHGHLIGSLRGDMASTGLGFLAWDPKGTGAQAGGGQVIATAGDLTSAFTNMIAAIGEQGCGYEAGLEGWYRFLIDPDPPADIVLEGGVTTVVGVDDVVLTQRQQFLRPDSLVAIIMLSDENDCSVIDYGQGWLTATETRLPSATSKCEENPNDKCCFSCKQDVGAVPGGCPGPVGSGSPDSNCQVDAMEGYGAGFLPAVDDQANLRCWQTKRRFGFDLLFPTSRYVDGLTKPEICGRQTDSKGNCLAVGNPLMTPSASYPDLSNRTDSSLIYLAGIIGVPWQDLATEATLDPNVQALDLMDFQALTTAGRWDMIVGDVNGTATSAPVPPSDPFMVESVDERSGDNPVTGQSIVGSSSTDNHATINGHETNSSAVSRRDDLQYACIFDLPGEMQRDCTLEEYTTQDPIRKKGCDCKGTLDEVAARNRPLCAANVQVAAKGYPGLRYLQVLKDFGTASKSSSSIVASVCPKFPSPPGGDTSAAQYGYNPAVTAIINRLKEKLKGACLSRPIVVDLDTGLIQCRVVEATQFGKVGTPECDSVGREALPGGLEAAILKSLEEIGKCGGKTGKKCATEVDDGFRLCLLKQAEGDSLDPGSDYSRCLNDQITNVTGYCYVDALQDGNGDGFFGCLTADTSGPGEQSGQAPLEGDCLGNPDLVKDCAPSMKRLLRFVSPEDARVPAKNSTVILACKGQNMAVQ